MNKIKSKKIVKNPEKPSEKPYTKKSNWMIIFNLFSVFLGAFLGAYFSYQYQIYVDEERFNEAGESNLLNLYWECKNVNAIINDNLDRLDSITINEKAVQRMNISLFLPLTFLNNDWEFNKYLTQIDLIQELGDYKIAAEVTKNNMILFNEFINNFNLRDIVTSRPNENLIEGFKKIKNTLSRMKLFSNVMISKIELFCLKNNIKIKRRRLFIEKN